ncbi:MAG TPA: hypothetical protein VFQ16_02885 [Burkholderiaceae bacterium]|nr:hypothetical protein [Burkholderiaceae bacterium]
MALGICVMFLGACDRTPASLPAPVASDPTGAEPRAAASAADPSLPSAESVFSAASAPKLDSAPRPPNKSMSAEQESTAMPMPGQNNDHSATRTTAKSASAP